MCDRKLGYLFFLRHAQPPFIYYILQYEWINVIVLFLISFFVARLRFSLVYLCVQFVSSAAALHFLVKWISSFIAPSSQGVYIPCLNSFFVRTTPNPDHSANEDLFFYNVHGILSLCLKIIAVVNEGEKVTTRHTSWQLLAHLFWRSLFLSSDGALRNSLYVNLLLVGLHDGFAWGVSINS